MSGTSASRTGRARVLIVDEPTLTAVLRTAHGCAPHAAVLPGLDGIRVLHRFRYENPKLPALILTTRDAMEHRIDGLHAITPTEYGR